MYTSFFDSILFLRFSFLQHLHFCMLSSQADNAHYFHSKFELRKELDTFRIVWIFRDESSEIPALVHWRWTLWLISLTSAMGHCHVIYGNKQRKIWWLALWKTIWTRRNLTHLVQSFFSEGICYTIQFLFANLQQDCRQTALLPENSYCQEIPDKFHQTQIFTGQLSRSYLSIHLSIRIYGRLCQIFWWDQSKLHVQLSLLVVLDLQYNNYNWDGISVISWTRFYNIFYRSH